MTKEPCPSTKLPRLLADDLSLVESESVMQHLENCHDCQSTLENLSANDTWWSRVNQSLSDIETDSHCRVVAAETLSSSIDTILGFGGNESDSSSGFTEALLDTSSHPEILGRIDEFDIEQKIGQGGMGIVFRGFDRSLNRPVAVKVIAPHLGSNDIARQRFEREAKAAAAVVHPNVVPIYRVSTADESRPYIAMALADGLSLQEYVHRNGPFDVKDVVRIGIQIASGLAEAHKQGLIHRDIKPANILMEKDVSRILITDFGLARAADDLMMTQSGCLAGTPGYMSPEQVTGGQITSRSDLFSLGSLLYFISTGREPFRAESAFAVINKVTRHNPKPPRTINVDIPEVLSRIIERLLEKNPDDRIESATKLEDLLTQVLANLQEPQQHKPPRVKATSRQRNKLWALIGLGIISIALGCGIFLWSIYGSPSSIPNLDHDQPSHSSHQDEHGEHQWAADSDHPERSRH